MAPPATTASADAPASVQGTGPPIGASCSLSTSASTTMHILVAPSWFTM